MYFESPQLGILYETLGYWSRLNFDFLEKGLGIVSPPNFVYDFLRKMFAWLPLPLAILVNCVLQLQLIVNQIVTSQISK